MPNGGIDTPEGHLTSDQVAADTGEDITEFLDLLTGVLLGFAAIGLVVAAFIIFNTFTILVAQRTHELGLLRAMGASRRQIIVSVVLEAGFIGVASVADLRSVCCSPDPLQ